MYVSKIYFGINGDIVNVEVKYIVRKNSYFDILILIKCNV